MKKISIPENETLSQNQLEKYAEQLRDQTKEYYLFVNRQGIIRYRLKILRGLYQDWLQKTIDTINMFEAKAYIQTVAENQYFSEEKISDDQSIFKEISKKIELILDEGIRNKNGRGSTALIYLMENLFDDLREDDFDFAPEASLESTFVNIAEKQQVSCSKLALLSYDLEFSQGPERSTYAEHAIKSVEEIIKCLFTP